MRFPFIGHLDCYPIGHGKMTDLEARAHELTPRAVAKRYLPENARDYALGGF